MKLGYVRVSSKGQNEQRQIKALEDAGADRIYMDKISGKNTDRPQLKEMLEYAREGDSIIVTSISRFARNTRDLLKLVEKLTDKKVDFISLKEKVDTTTPAGRFFLTMMGAMAELERDYILERQQEGIAIAKEKGIKFGRKRVGEDAKTLKAIDIYYKEDIGITKAAAIAGVSRTTFHRRLIEYAQREEREHVNK